MSTSPVPGDGGAAAPLFELRQILGFAWRHRRFAAAVTLVVLVAGTTILSRMTPLYTATAQILLERTRERPPGGDVIQTVADPDVAMVEGEMAILKSTVFLRRVVAREHLAAARIPPPPAWQWLAALSAGSGAAAAAATPALAAEAAEVHATQSLDDALKVSRATQFGFVLNIAVTSPYPAKAAALANAVANAYLVDKLDTRFEAVKRASAWLGDRLRELRRQLRQSEEAVAQYRAAHGLYQSDGGAGLSQQQLSELNGKLVEARADLAQQKARVDLLDAAPGKGGSRADRPEPGDGGALPALRQQQNQLAQQEAELLSRYGPAHPLVVNLRAQQREVARSIAAERQRLAAAIRGDYRLAQSKVASLEASLRQATGQTSADDQTTIRLRELERTAAVDRTLFDDFLQRAKVAEQQSNFEPQQARIISPAVPPSAPSYPRKGVFLFVNLAIGLTLGVAGAVVKEKLNNGFTTAKEVEDTLHLPVLASIVRLADRERASRAAVVPVHDYPAVKSLSQYSEAIRALRSGVHMTDVDNPPKVIQFTSAAPGEGKTTIALSVARSAALSKLQVLFVDADLRRSAASHIFGLASRPGLVELLLGAVDAEAVIRYQETAGYWVLSAGEETRTPTDLLGSARMKSLIADFRQRFDLVVIDTSPLAPVVDPVVVAGLADKVVLAVRWGATPRDLVKECARQLSNHKKIAGVALNLVNDRQARRYGQHPHSYYFRQYQRRHYAE